MSAHRTINYLKASGVLVMSVYGFFCAFDAAEAGFLDRLDLVIHEAGHLFFSWFGEVAQVLGGTIAQLFLPAALIAYFSLRREFFASSAMLFWTGQNLLNISVYVKDAQTMDLPLVAVAGGEDVIHDWNYILSRIGLLRWDGALGNAVFALGVIVMMAAVAWGSYSSVNRGDEERLSLRPS